MDFFRKMVSGDKRRYVTDKFNLDLTYITDRVIAMAFPATGMEAAYRNDGTQVASLLKESHPGHFLIYNLTERKYDTTLFEGRVHDCGWHDHHAPPIGQLFEIIDHMHNFLLRDRDNVVAIHCLAGKGRTGTVIVSYLLYSGLFHDPDEAALFFALRRSNNNWGVTGPSQQRYIRYFWEILRSRRAPTLSTPLRLTSIKMSGPPKFSVGSKRSFSPIITAVDVSGGLVQQQLWSTKGDRTFTDDNEPIVFDLVAGPDALPQPLLLLGDLNFTVDSWGAFGRKSKFARFAFNTGMVINENESQIEEESFEIDGSATNASSSQAAAAAAAAAAPFAAASSSNASSSAQSNLPPSTIPSVSTPSSSAGASSSSHGGDLISGASAPHRKESETLVLRFPKLELDDACSDKRTPDGFYIELTFQRIFTQSWLANYTFLTKREDTMWERIFSEYRDTNGVACFQPRQDMSLVQIISNARALTDARSGEPPKMGGWLTKRGHRVKNWKKRWFALHSNTLAYSKSPKSTTPAGIIQLDDIIAVRSAEPGEVEHQNAFIIYTNWDDYICYSSNESDMEEWINTLNLTLQIREQKRELSESIMGQLYVSVLDISNVPCTEYYTVVQLGSQQSKAATTNSFGKEVVFDVYQRSSDAMVIQLWEENTYLPDALIGEIQVVLDMFQTQPTKPLELIQVYPFRHQITRVKVKITYRPKALIEAQRTPTLSSSRPGGMVPVQLSSSNTARQANSPNRSVTLNSKIVTQGELKELIEILDFGLTEALRAPDADVPGTDPVWDWTVASSLTGISQPSLAREHRYSAVPHLIEQDLPIYMRPISLDIGLPPSDFIPPTKPLSTTSPRSERTVSLQPPKPASTETQEMPTPDERALSPRPYGATPGSVKREVAYRAVTASHGVVPTLDMAAKINTNSDSADAESTVTRAISPRPRAAATRVVVSPRQDLASGEPVSPRGATSLNDSSPSALSPRSSESPSPRAISPLHPTERDNGSSESGESGTASDLLQSSGLISPRNGESIWRSTHAPSESLLEPIMDEVLGQTKSIQTQGNAARDRRSRARRPTMQSPPEFKDMDKVLSLSRESSSDVSRTPSNPESPHTPAPESTS